MLQAWLLFNTFVSLPTEDQPLDFYQQVELLVVVLTRAARLELLGQSWY